MTITLKIMLHDRQTDKQKNVYSIDDPAHTCEESVPNS